MDIPVTFHDLTGFYRIHHNCEIIDYPDEMYPYMVDSEVR